MATKKDKNRSKLLPPKKKREIKPYEASQNLFFSQGSVTKKKRKGAGPGSGLGKTSGRGHKGQKSRSGGSIAVGFEGGQMPLQRRIPKRGFVNIHRIKYSLINLTKLQHFKENDNIDKEVFQKAGYISSKKAPVKLLGLGDVTKPLVVHVDKASRSAIEKIEKAGGKVILSAKKSVRKKWVKKDKNLRLSRKIKKMNKKKNVNSA